MVMSATAEMTPLRGGRIHDRDKIVKLTLEGRSARDIAAIVGCSTRTVERIRVAEGVGGRPPSLMTPDEVAIAERMLNDGASLSEVARTLGRGGVPKRWKGRGWKKSDGPIVREMFAELESLKSV